jgi:hypothetical protein
MLKSQLKVSRTGKLVTRFDVFQQLRAEVRWGTLQTYVEDAGKFEAGSTLAGFVRWREVSETVSKEHVWLVLHDPSPSMLRTTRPAT